MAFSQAQLKQMAGKGSKAAQQALDTYAKQIKTAGLKRASVKKGKAISTVPILIKNLELAGITGMKWQDSIGGEFMFHPRRKWKLDIYFPEYKVAIEVEGGIASHGKGDNISRHLHLKGFEEDAVKYFEAGKLGILVVRVSSGMVKDGRAASMVIQSLESRGYVNMNPNSAYCAFKQIVDN